MSLVKVGEKALAAVQDDEIFKKPRLPKKKKVLDEETFTKDMEKIIEREFFPDLPKLHAQTEYYDALQRKDLVKLREIHIKYGPKRPNAKTPDLYSTPATFETPEGRPSTVTPGPSKDKDNVDKISDKEGAAGSETAEEMPTHNPEPKTKKKPDTDLSLDKYLSRNTSEDNANFQEILEENQEKHKQKHAWLYEQEEEKLQDKEKALALPSIEKQAIQEGPRTQELQSWEYTPKNALMYVPSGSELSAKELVEMKKKKPREIIHNNTRFKNNPFNVEKSKETIAEAASNQAVANVGRIGVDGKELMPGQSPQVNGWGFVATPSPAPGVEESPLMTWGEIEGTPFRLDGGDTPITNSGGPKFKMADIPRRDQIGFELAEQASKAHRDKKDKALKRVSALATPVPRFGSTRTDRLSSMSPAAQRLASTKLGIRTHTDKALRASYTPSPSHRLTSKTPSLTPRITPKRTPKTRTATPKASTVTTPKRATEEVSSLTDNLLNLPTQNKRPRAEDFF